MTAFLGKELGAIAFCWRLRRRDGIALGFTTHDRDLSIEGITYRASPGMVPSAISLSDGFDASTLDVSGALTSDAIRDEDLAAGRWDGAEVRMFMIDWSDPAAGQLPLARGELGDVAIEGGKFSAELRGPTALLDRPVVEQTSPECRAELGDRRCRIDLAYLVRVTRVAAVLADDRIEVGSAAAGSGLYRYGRLRWIGGANSGIDSAILGSGDRVLTLREPPPYPVLAGDLIEIGEGCDKAFATCRERFANSRNFRGEPHLPGIDLLTRYGG